MAASSLWAVATETSVSPGSCRVALLTATRRARFQFRRESVRRVATADSWSVR